MTTKPIPIAILASGRGSGFDAIIKAISARQLRANVVALVSDQPQAPVIEKAKKAGIPALVLSVDKTLLSLEERRQKYDQAILTALKPYSPRFLVMAGYMRIVTQTLIEGFRSEKKYTRIVNIHPSILPAFPGVKSYEQAYNHGVKIAGVTIHFLEQEIDNGPICAQESFSIEGCRSAEEVEQLGLQIEHRLYPKTLNWILPEKFDVELRAGRLCVRQS